MSKKCDRSSTNDPQTCKSNRKSSPDVHPKSRETMPESPQASVCLSSGRKIARHRTEKYHQHSSLLFDRARKTSRTVCHEMPRSSSKNIKTIQRVCETHQSQTHAREVQPVVGQRPTDLQIQPEIKSCRTPKIARNDARVSTSKCLPIAWEKEPPNIARKSNHSSLSSSGEAKIRTTADDPDSPPDGARQRGRLPPPGRRVARQRTPSRDKPGGLPSPASFAVPRRGKTL